MFSSFFKQNRDYAHTLKMCVACIVLFFCALPTIASEENSIFINYSRAEGLNHKFIYNIIRDKDGFIWIASSSGLSRFDSYTFENYINSTHDSNFLEGTAIYGIAEGKENRIWLSTDAGLGFFDKTKENFSYIENSLLKNNVFRKDICVDEEGCVWLYNQDLKFVVYDPDKDSVVRHIPDFSGWGVDTSFYVSHFVVANGAIWMSSNQGVAMYDYVHKKFSFICKDKHTHCHNVRRVDKNTITVTYMFEGIYVIDIEKKTSYFVKKSYIDEKIGIKTSFFDAVLEADSTLWISVSPGMVSIKNNDIVYYSNSSLQNYFNGDVVSCLYRDVDNNLWIGSYGDGIFLKKKNNSKFNFTTRLYKGDIKKTYISGFTVFGDGSLLYRDSKGIFACPNYKTMKIDGAEMIVNFVSSFLFPLDERYALISSADTIFEYDSRNKTVTRSFVCLAPSSVYKDSSGIIWIGAWHGFLYGYDRNGKKKYEIPLNTRYPVTVICGDKDGSLWLGTNGIGVVHISKQTLGHPVLEYYNKNGKGKNFINTNIINCLFIDASDNLWIGSNGAGLLKRDPVSGNFEVFTTRDGLKSNIIESISSDNDGNIWFASVVLSKYNTEKRVFTHYSNFEGLSSGFVSRACQKTFSGDLVFANTTGMFVFNPKEISETEYTSVPLLTNLKIRGATVYAGDSIDGFVFNSNSITYSDYLELPYSLNTFTIEFASIHFQESQTINYEYMLEGVDDSWILADTRTRTASYSGLQPGEYDFKVRASFGEGKWSVERILPIEIIPPWWKTWWFRFFSVLFGSLAISIFIFMRFRAIKQQSLFLDKKVKERTEELSLANNQLHRQNEQLKEHQLVIEMRNLDLNEAVQAKNELIKVISHDFRNPLSGIIGMAELLKNENSTVKSEKSALFADVILTSANTLVSQMTNVLDWAQSLNKNLVASPIEINLEVLLDDAISLVDENARQKNIIISKQLDYSTNALVDPRMISTVFRNLLSNAIKFTNAGGSILVRIQEFDKVLDIVIIDTGIGIPPDILDKLFVPNNIVKSSYGTENEKGTGIGLQVCKSFIEKNSGTIRIASQVGSGTQITVTLPKGQNPAVKKIQPVKTDVQNASEQVLTDEKTLVLVIDDNIEIREIVQNIFDQNITVLKAEDGNEGLYIAQNMLPDIIICDINLPGKSGIEICNILKKNELTCHIPILLITSEQGENIENKGFESGANDFIQKPFNPFALKQKVISILEYRNHILDSIKKSIEGEKQENMPLDYDSKMIRKVIDLIENNISDSELNTETVADKIGVSRSQMWRIFKNTTGKSMGDYIREIRMKKAAEMLKTGKFRISEVAYEVGYADAKNFTRNFQKEFGMTPSQYIESSQK